MQPAASNLVLRKPTPADEQPVANLHRQLEADEFSFVLASGPWLQILEWIARESAGDDLPPGRVRSDFLLAEVDGQVVGRASIRYELNDFLYRIGGHVGYAVGPDFRRRGHATEILRQCVQILNDAGVDRVLVTCDDDNVASARTIERCGGVLENVVEHEDGTPKRRYWIG
ncbi:GNAT family N-acetyltransferase [Luteococcus sp. Sow4_B9]|uniref:GNAT family N-acetyltransferase n=1 Tax=Luteococcus sp. Sow4_B9 TaxID=3438792 RepID=UPI003F9B6897